MIIFINSFHLTHASAILQKAFILRELQIMSQEQKAGKKEAWLQERWDCCHEPRKTRMKFILSSPFWDCGSHSKTLRRSKQFKQLRREIRKETQQAGAPNTARSSLNGEVKLPITHAFCWDGNFLPLSNGLLCSPTSYRAKEQTHIEHCPLSTLGSNVCTTS